MLPPTPWSLVGRLFRLSEKAVIAVPSPGAILYRLVIHDPPEFDDFQPPRPRLAEKLGHPELGRTALSHFARAEQALEIKWKDSQRVARVRIPAHPRIHVARTERDVPGHYDVWLPQDLIEPLLETAEIVG